MGNNPTITGMTKVDEILDGELRKGALYLIASCPGYGKTTLASQMAGNIAKSGKRVCFISLELVKEQIEELMAKQGNGEVSLFIDDSSALTTQEIKEQIIAQNADVAIIDYLGLISIEGEFKYRIQETTEITRQLKVIAKELQIPIVCLSLLSRREMRERGKGHIPRPKLPEDLRVFGSIEQDCDVVVFLHRDENSKDNSTEIIVAKNRYGSTGSIDVYCDSDKLIFTENNNLKSETK